MINSLSNLRTDDHRSSTLFCCVSKANVILSTFTNRSKLNLWREYQKNIFNRAELSTLKTSNNNSIEYAANPVCCNYLLLKVLNFASQSPDNFNHTLECYRWPSSHTVNLKTATMYGCQCQIETLPFVL